MEQRLQSEARQAPAFAAGLRGYRRAMAAGQSAIAEGLLAWVAGQPNVGAEIKRFAAIKGEIDHFAALNFLQGLLVILRDSGHKGLLICLDEVETLQRMRGDAEPHTEAASRRAPYDSGIHRGDVCVTTNTIMTRTRYPVFLPALCLGVEQEKLAGKAAERRLTDLENQLRESLSKEESQGVIHQDATAMDAIDGRIHG